MHKNIFFILSCTLFAFALDVSASERDRELLLDRLVESSGAKRQILQLPEMFKSVLAQEKQRTGKPLATSEQARVDAFIAALSPDWLMEVFRRRMDQELSDADLSLVLQWLESPAGRMFTHAEEQASEPEAYAKMLASLGKLLADTERSAKMDQIEDALQMTDQTLMLMAQMMAVSKEMQEQQGLMQDSQRPEVVQKFRAKLEPTKPMVRAQMKSMLLYMYQDIPLAEFDGYLSFYRSDAGKRYVNAGMDANADCIVYAFQKSEQTRVHMEKEEPPKVGKLIPQEGPKRQTILPITRYKIGHSGMFPTLQIQSVVWAQTSPYRDITEVQRGDIVTFEVVKDAKTYVFIWRVIGLPGDVIETRDQALFLNGVALPRALAKTQDGYLFFTETNGQSTYQVIYMEHPAEERTPFKTTVPPGELFLLGDNRDNAQDSRYEGTIKFDAILAKLIDTD